MRFSALPVEMFSGVRSPIVFIRSDANGDDILDVSDPVASLLYLFVEDVEAGCLDAVDGNDDGEVNITDPNGLLGFLFRGEFSPRDPFPECGGDSTEDVLTCEISLDCSAQVSTLCNQFGRSPGAS